MNETDIARRQGLAILLIPSLLCVILVILGFLYLCISVSWWFMALPAVFVVSWVVIDILTSIGASIGQALR